MTEQELIEVRLIGIPLDIQSSTNAHYDALFREFELIRQSDNAAGTVPVRVLDLIDELSTRFDEFSEQPRALLEAALQDGSSSVDLVYQVPREVVDACHKLLQLLDEADEYCRAGEHLVTLASSPMVRAYRDWFLREFIEQDAGRPPTPWSDHAPAPDAAPTAGDDGREDRGSPAPVVPLGDNELWPTTVEGRSATVTLAGELDLVLAPSLRAHLNSLHTEGVREFTLDSAGVEFIDSVGLSVLLALYRRCREEDGTVALVQPSPQLRRTLEISGLLEVLDVH